MSHFLPFGSLPAKKRVRNNEEDEDEDMEDDKRMKMKKMEKMVRFFIFGGGEDEESFDIYMGSS